MPCGDTIATTFQYTVLQVDRSCCISTSVTATSEATSWALPPILACCCCVCCCAAAGYAISRGSCPCITRRLDVLRGTGFTTEHSLRANRKSISRSHHSRSSDSRSTSHHPALELPGYRYTDVSYAHRSESDSASELSSAESEVITYQPRPFITHLESQSSCGTCLDHQQNGIQERSPNCVSPSRHDRIPRSGHPTYRCDLRPGSTLL
ncbi:NS22 [Fall chinook aquareovirus]|uniref:NS22 n=1 Tax=Fall chinook aquareovirus TaxID=1963254 RepID=UPI00099577A8|nr:NS22 [Fall chinook aquareovirus]AQU42731.1 NS22 [Fall chinook aquareovirus]